MYGNKASAGKFLVVRVTFFPQSEQPSQEYFSREFALALADTYNDRRNKVSDDVLRVYDDQGNHVPGRINP